MTNSCFDHYVKCCIVLYGIVSAMCTHNGEAGAAVLLDAARRGAGACVRAGRRRTVTHAPAPAPRTTLSCVVVVPYRS